MPNRSTTAAIDLAATAWGSTPQAPGAAAALEKLARLHRQEARADLARVHSTWLVRAAQYESPAVRAIVAGFGPPSVQSALRAALGEPRSPDRRPHPEVLDWALALWTERLIGGEPQRDDDPPVIAALTRLSPRGTYRLWLEVGQTKRRLAADPDQRPEIRDFLKRDIDAAEQAPFGFRRRTALLGLLTAARLLADCELFRSRWALQHLPYPFVKQIRRFTPPPDQRSSALSQLEGRILKIAWDRLASAGRLSP